MPLVRIGLARGKPPGYRQAVADVIYTAMTGVLNVPNDDRFMVITEHDQASKANAKATVPAHTRIRSMCSPLLAGQDHFSPSVESWSLHQCASRS